VEYSRLAYDAALRALDKQESVLDELRSRTGVLLAASALAASFLGRDAFRDPSPVLAVIALAAFLASIAACVFILVPRSGRFVFSISGPVLFAGLYEDRDDLGEVYRRLAYALQDFWDENDENLQPLFGAYRFAAVALVAQILSLVALVSDTIL
jgi:hypothetical protein